MPSSRPFRLVAGFHAALVGGLLLAQTPLADSEEQRRRAQEEAEERQRLRQAPDIRLPEPPLPAEDDRDLRLPEESPGFPIHRFELEVPGPLKAAAGIGEAGGAGRFRFAQRYLDRYRGRRIGPDGLKLLLRRLTRRIMLRGYTTTRVDLPAQDLSGGTLRITLIPGVIHQVRLAQPAPGGAWRTCFPMRPGALLNVRDLEQGLEQMKRVPSQDVAVALVPGPRLGESDVVLTVRRGRPWRGGLAVDDSGLAATGRWQGTLQAGWDGPLGRSDLLTAHWSHDLDSHRKGSGTRGAGLSWALPLGYWTFQANWSQQDHAQRIAGRDLALLSSGDSRTLEGRLGWLFHRNQRTKDTLQVRVGNRASRSFLNGFELDVQRRNHSYLELALVRSQFLGRAHLDLTAAHRRGVAWFRARPDLGGDGPTSYYRLHSLDASLVAPLVLGGQSLAYSATLRAQYTDDRLYAAEYVTLGGRWTVRGFDGACTLAAERGVFLRNQLDFHLDHRAALFLGLDGGRVGGPGAQTLPGRNLAGAVLGLRGVLGGGVGFQVFMGGPVHRPRGFAASWPVFGCSASLSF